MRRLTYQGSVNDWGRKIERAATRLGVPVEWDVHRGGAWLRFSYRGADYVLEQTQTKAREAGIELPTMRDCLAQVALTLEDLARMTERGIYELGVLAAGLKALPAPSAAAPPFQALGFTTTPDLDALHQRYRELARTHHPDGGGDPEGFRRLTEAVQAAEALLRDQ